MWLAWDKVPWQGISDTTRPGVAWGSVVFACVHCQGIFMYALVSLGVLFFSVTGIWDNVHWHPLDFRFFCVPGMDQCALPSGLI